MTAPRGRLQFADWLRAWALLVMVETHVFNAFLAAGCAGRPGSRL